MNRRNLLKLASWGALAQVSGLSPLRSIAALAQSSSAADYKAIVCFFLRGGNDSNSLVVPMSGSQYSIYQNVRGSSATAQGSLLSLPGTGVGLHPAFTNLSSAFNSGQAAVIANVGTLIQPITAAQYIAATAQTPAALMSHADQQEVWEIGGDAPGTGPSWTGLMDDAIGGIYNSTNLPMTTILGEATSFGLGNTSNPFTAPDGGGQAATWCSAGNWCGGRVAAAQQLLSFNNGVSLVQADEQVYKRTYQYMNFYNSIVAGASGFRTAFPASNPIMGSLQTVATMMQLRNTIGARRQVFLVNVGGYDTHADQTDALPALFAQLDQAVGTFIAFAQELGIYNDVALFTASDFSRTLAVNSDGGTDHAWGGHHFAVGGPVKGGKIYGSFPDLTLNGPNDIDGTGRYVPTTGLSQYMATLAAWFGVPAAQLPNMLPGLSNFSSQNLGFI